MTALARRLASLQRQAGSAPPGPVRTAPAVAARHGAAGHEAQVAQLRRLLGLRPATVVAVASRDRHLDGEEVAPGLRYVELRHACAPPPGVLNLSILRHDDLASSRILAFDTETTGLAGGTGTRAFMIGAADWRDGGLRIRQLLMTTLAAETAMLSEFARWLAPDTVLLSYNGKSYDRPLLSTRYTLARLADPLLGRAHLDLLHPVRRLYRGAWENCRLATAERRLLGVLREDDLPGSEAPAAWLHYLRGGGAANLRRVGHHNAQDLRSLTGLLMHLERLSDLDSRRSQACA